VDSKMKKLTIIVIICIAAWFIFFKPPAPRSVIDTMQIDATTRIIEYKQMMYKATWSEEKVFSGDLRYIGPVYRSALPILTHTAAITSGEYSNPALVTIEPRGGDIAFGFRKEPTGSIDILLLIPADAMVYDTLANLKGENKVTIKGRTTQEIDISDKDGKIGGKGMLSNEHQKFILVTAVQ